MKAFLSCSAYCHKTENSLDQVRWEKWCSYYKGSMEQLGVDRLFIIDDASENETILPESTVICADDPLPIDLPGNIATFRFSKHLGRESEDVFPGWWRSFSFTIQLAEHFGYEKILFIESDCFVRSQRLMDYIRQLQSGWTSFVQYQYRSRSMYVRHWNRNDSVVSNIQKKLWYLISPNEWAESGIHVICKDSFPALRELWEGGEPLWSKSRYAEVELPYTCIERGFLGGRYFEQGLSVPENADFVSQVPIEYIFTPNE